MGYVMWFNSQLLNDAIINEECLKEVPLYKDYIDDLKNLHVTKKNYQNLIALSNYLMIDNPDDLIDKILKIHKYDYSIIYKFEVFYKLTKRLVPFETKKNFYTLLDYIVIIIKNFKLINDAIIIFID